MASLVPISQLLGTKGAAHLLRRATFGPTRQMIDQFAVYTIDQALNILFAPIVPQEDTTIEWLVTSPIPGEDIDENHKIKLFKGWLLDRMRGSGPSALEKMTFFMHTHFTTIASVVEKHTALYFQNKLFRSFALGNIKTLARKICSDNAMLVLLDGRLNVNENPNENFAREFFELFTIGKGPSVGEGDYTNYTELDIKEAAKVLSGLNTDFTYSTIDKITKIPTGIFKTSRGGAASGAVLANKHDGSSKTFSNRFNFTTIIPTDAMDNMASVDAAQNEMDQLVDMVFKQPETAKNICRKLYRFFVYYKISDEIERDIIGPLSTLLIQSDFEIKPVLEKLLKSQHFFDVDNNLKIDDSRGAIIKSPLELSLGIMIYFNSIPNLTVPENAPKSYIGPNDTLLKALHEQGMNLYDPLDVSGYDAYSQSPFYNRNWISANYLANRYLFPFLLLHGNKPQSFFGYYIDVMEFVNNSENFNDPSDATLLLQEMVDYLLPESISSNRLLYFKNAFLNDFKDQQWLTEWNIYKTNGNDKVVKSLLETLIWTILKSPEYQLN